MLMSHYSRLKKALYLWEMNRCKSRIKPETKLRHERDVEDAIVAWAEDILRQRGPTYRGPEPTGPDNEGKHNQDKDTCRNRGTPGGVPCELAEGHIGLHWAKISETPGGFATVEWS